MESVDLSEDNLTTLKSIRIFDWIVFTNPDSASAFVAASMAAGNDEFILDDVNVLAFGEAVSDALRFNRIHSDIIAPQFSPAGILAALRSYEQADEFLDQTLLFVGLSDDCEYYGKALEDSVKSLELLDLRIPWFTEVEGKSKLRTLILNGACDRIVLTTDREVYDFVSYLGTPGCKRLARESVFEISGPGTLEAAAGFGFKKRAGD
jgi:uroporphyrinogen-III synthase